VPLEDVLIVVKVGVRSEKRILIVDCHHTGAVVRGFGMHDQGCG
jgi:hypothetical protein